MIKKYIPEPDLKLLVDFLRLAVNADLEFQAVYEVVMGSFQVQTRLFKALTDKKDAFVDVHIKRKPRKIILKFSCLPNSLISDAFAESLQNKQLALKTALEIEKINDSILKLEPIEPIHVEKNEIITNSNSEINSFEAKKLIDLNPIQPELNIVSDIITPQSEQKRKGRGKAKKQSSSRSLVTVLIDDSDIALLNDLAIEQDLTLSYFVRSAIKSYLKQYPIKLPVDKLSIA